MVVTLRESFFLALFYLGHGIPKLALATFFAVLPILKGDVVMSDTLIGDMRSLMSILYACGSLVSGPGSDAYGPRGIWSAVVAITALCAIAVSVANSDSITQVVMCMSVQRFCQGFTFTLMVATLPAYFQGSKFTTALSIVSTSSRIFAMLAGYLASAFLGSPGGWRKALQICAAACIIEAFFLFVFLAPVRKKQDTVDESKLITTAGKAVTNFDKNCIAGAEADDANSDVSSHSKPDKSYHQPRLTEVLYVVFSSPRMLLWLLFLTLIFPNFSLEEVFPLYFVAQGMPAQDAARVSAGFPAGMAVVLPLAGLLSDRFPKLASGLFPLGVFLSAILILLLSKLDVNTSSWTETIYMQTIIAQALLFVIGFCLAPAVYLPPFEFANTYGGEHNKGLIVSFLETAGLLGEALFNFVLPSLVSLVGWRGVMVGCAGMLVVASESGN